MEETRFVLKQHQAAGLQKRLRSTEHPNGPSNADDDLTLKKSMQYFVSRLANSHFLKKMCNKLKVTGVFPQISKINLSIFWQH